MQTLPQCRATCADRKQPFLVATDSEWDASFEGRWVSTAFAFPTGDTIVYFRGVPKRVWERLRAEARRLGVRISFVCREDSTDLLAMALKEFGFGPGRRVRLVFFYSAKDVEYALGWD